MRRGSPRSIPQVQNGQFQIDLQFIGAEPPGIQRGQTLQARLTLGDPAPARLIPNGAFYNETGGAWVFVVAPDGAQRGEAPGPARPPQRRQRSRCSTGSTPASA